MSIAAFKEYESRYYNVEPPRVRSVEPDPGAVGAGVGVRSPQPGPGVILDVLDYPSRMLRWGAQEAAEAAAKERNPVFRAAAVGATAGLGFFAGALSLISPRAWWETGKLAFGVATFPVRLAVRPQQTLAETGATLAGLKAYYAANPWRLLATGSELIGAFAVGAKFLRVPVTGRYKLVRESVEVRAPEAAFLKLEYPVREPYLVRMMRPKIAETVHEGRLRLYGEYPEIALAEKSVMRYAGKFMRETYGELPLRTSVKNIPEYVQPRVDYTAIAKSGEVFIKEKGFLERAGWRLGWPKKEYYYVESEKALSMYAKTPERIQALYYEPGKILSHGEIRFKGGEYTLTGYVGRGEYAYFPSKFVKEMLEVEPKVREVKVREAEIPRPRQPETKLETPKVEAKTPRQELQLTQAEKLKAREVEIVERQIAEVRAPAVRAPTTETLKVEGRAETRVSETGAALARVREAEAGGLTLPVVAETLSLKERTVARAEPKLKLVVREAEMEAETPLLAPRAVFEPLEAVAVRPPSRPARGPTTMPKAGGGILPLTEWRPLLAFPLYEREEMGVQTPLQGLKTVKTVELNLERLTAPLLGVELAELEHGKPYMPGRHEKLWFGFIREKELGETVKPYYRPGHVAGLTLRLPELGEFEYGPQEFEAQLPQLKTVTVKADIATPVLKPRTLVKSERIHRQRHALQVDILLPGRGRKGEEAGKAGKRWLEGVLPEVMPGFKLIGSVKFRWG